MSTFYFQTKEFGVSDNGVHLLRSGFNYKTITFSEVENITIGNGKEVHNWWLVFILGAVLLALGVYLSLGALKILIEGNIAPRHARMVFFLLIPVVGGYFVYNALQTGLVLKIVCANGDKDMFPLREIVRDKKLKEFKTHLKDKIGTRLHVTA